MMRFCCSALVPCRIATNFSLRPDVSFRGEADMDRQAKPAGSVENDPFRKSRDNSLGARSHSPIRQ